jgi:hypothetical protein
MYSRRYGIELAFSKEGLTMDNAGLAKGMSA